MKLEKLLALCKLYGVSGIDYKGIKIDFGQAPPKDDTVIAAISQAIEDSDYETQDQDNSSRCSKRISKR